MTYHQEIWMDISQPEKVINYVPHYKWNVPKLKANWKMSLYDCIMGNLTFLEYETLSVFKNL